MVIYDLNYLMNANLTDDDLHNLLDCDSLTYSLIIDMYKYAGICKTNGKIIKEIKLNNSWLTTNTWHRNQLVKYEKQLARVYRNLYQYSPGKCKNLAQWWIIQYGFQVK